MADTRTTLPDLDTLDIGALKHVGAGTARRSWFRVTPRSSNLKLLVLKLKRMQFGHKSEKLDRKIEQLELRLEELEAAELTQPNGYAGRGRS